MTSAITCPLHEEVRQAVMAADVLMGTDAHCGAWIARYREDADRGPTRGRRGGREGRRRAAAPPRRPDAERRRAVTPTPSALVVFTPSGKRGRFAPGTTCSTRRAQPRASISTRCAAGAASAGGARWW